jgi:hypothetical protein
LLALDLLILLWAGGVVTIDVVILVGGVDLLPLGIVGDEVGGVTALEAAPRWSPPLFAELVQGSELSHQQGDLIVWDDLVLLIKCCGQRERGKLQSRWDNVMRGWVLIFWEVE